MNDNIIDLEQKIKEIIDNKKEISRSIITKCVDNIVNDDVESCILIINCSINGTSRYIKNLLEGFYDYNLKTNNGDIIIDMDINGIDDIDDFCSLIFLKELHKNNYIKITIKLDKHAEEYTMKYMNEFKDNGVVIIDPTFTDKQYESLINHIKKEFEKDEYDEEDDYNLYDEDDDFYLIGDIYITNTENLQNIQIREHVYNLVNAIPDCNKTKKIKDSIEALNDLCNTDVEELFDEIFSE